MKKVVLFCILIFGALLCYAQEEGEITFDSVEYNMNIRGDQVFRVALEGAGAWRPRNLGFGGNVALGYHYFLDSFFSVGGDVNFLYHRTYGSNVFYCVPVMARGSFQANIGRFEFPISLSAGVALQSYLNQFYFGPVVKPEVGAFYRYSADWSIGVTVGTTFLPQIYLRDRTQSRTATVIDAGLSIKYHF